MHPIITLDLMKARASDLHRQAGRDALSLAARRADQKEHTFHACSRDR
jgi:hypothetical protein